MPKAPLNRQAYIDAAYEIIADIGVDKLSMRKVATHLGVSPMAMYKHFPNKEALLTATLDEMIARADIYPDENLAWPQWIEHVARGMYASLCEETHWVPLLGSLRLGSQAASVTDAFVKKLTTTGFSVEQSLQAFFAVIQMAIGAACLHASMNQDTDLNSSMEDKVASLTLAYLEDIDSERLKIAPALNTIAQLDQLSIGLPLLIKALKAQLTS